MFQQVALHFEVLINESPLPDAVLSYISTLDLDKWWHSCSGWLPVGENTPFANWMVGWFGLNTGMNTMKYPLLTQEFKPNLFGYQPRGQVTVQIKLSWPH